MIKGKRSWMKWAIIGSIVMTTGGCSLLPAEEQPLAPPLFKPVKENLETFEVKPKSIVKRVKGVGIFEATNIKYHQFTASGGKVKEVFVRAGDKVQKGDVLVQLEIEGLDLEMKYKRLDLEKAKQGLEDAKRNQNTEQMKLKMMELDIAQTQHDLTMSKLNSKQLFAEMDGDVVWADSVKPGDWVDPYRVLVNVADTTNMRISYTVTTAIDVQDVLVGMPAEITFRGLKYDGKVVQTPQSAPITDNQQLRDKYSRSLYITVDDLPAEALIGNSVDINIVTEMRDDTLVIPARGLRSYFGRSYVQVLEGESRTEADVEIGIKTPTEVEILSGLKEGQVIILP